MMEILLLLGLVLLNGLFAMSEIALVAARKSRLLQQANAGDPSAKVALKLGNDPTKFLSTIQIGITSISILDGIVGQSVLAAPLSRWLGGGRLGWKQVGALERGRIFFRVRGGGETPVPGRREPTLRFLLVDQMDRLVLEILEHSPNLRFPE